MSQSPMAGPTNEPLSRDGRASREMSRLRIGEPGVIDLREQVWETIDPRYVSNPAVRVAIVDELLPVVERLQRAAVAEALREAAADVMREHGTASLAAKLLRARAIAVDAL